MRVKSRSGYPELSPFAGGRGDLSSVAGRGRGYIVKSIIREELLRAVREVHQGRQYVDPIVASHLAERRTHRSLSSREVEVLPMVAKGTGNKEIATALNKSRKQP
jgi:DNA-binding NarL/FixJ family response regulator